MPLSRLSARESVAPCGEREREREIDRERERERVMERERERVME
jgi:hypothetical protein